MDMSMASTTTAAVAAATSAASMGMDMGTGACKISMLWNWYTIDSCFISATWHIRSTSMFAGSCIGVILLTMSLEFLRRVSKEYDRFILRQFQRHQLSLSCSTSVAADRNGGDGVTFENTPLSPGINSKANLDSYSTSSAPQSGKSKGSHSSRLETPMGNKATSFRPNLLQQLVRASIHALQFGTAYFVMLLAMYYNGYFIICILIGAWLGAFIFGWETVGLEEDKGEVTVCCG